MAKLQTNLLKVGLRFIKTFSGALIHNVQWIRSMSGANQKDPVLPEGLELASFMVGLIKCEALVPQNALEIGRASCRERV